MRHTRDVPAAVGLIEPVLIIFPSFAARLTYIRTILCVLPPITNHPVPVPIKTIGKNY